MAKFATPDLLAIGDWFIDPEREGRRPAQVVKLLGSKGGKVLFELDDNAPLGPWTASYNVDVQLELV